MEFENIRILIEYWSRINDIYVPEDIIGLLITFRGAGEVAAISVDGLLYVAEFTSYINSNKLNNLSLHWARCQNMNPNADFLNKKLTNYTLCLTPNNNILFRLGGGYPCSDIAMKYDFTKHSKIFENQNKEKSKNTNINCWQEMKEMNYKRASSCAACLDNQHCIVVGGAVLDGYCAEEYDIQTNEWKILAPCLTDRVGSCLVRINNNQCILIGGKNTGSCEIYNREMNEWSYVATISEAFTIYQFGAVCWNDLIYIGGGSQQRNALQYNITRNVWKFIAPLKYAHRPAIMGVCFVASAVFIHGYNSYCSELYDDRVQKWIEISDSGKDKNPINNNNMYFNGNLIAFN